MNNISVTVRNRLGTIFGRRRIEVNEDDDPSMHSVDIGDQVQLSLSPDNNLKRIGIEALPPADKDFPENGIIIPITIDSPQNYIISTLNHESENTWRIDFEAPEIPTESGGEAETEPPPVNVTVGQDDPDWSGENLGTILVYSGVAAVLTAVLTEVSTILGLTVPVSLFVAAVVNRLLGR